MLAHFTHAKPYVLKNKFRLSRLHTLRTKEDSRWPGWDVVIGIEVHAQIKSRTKLFSSTLTSDPHDPPNTHVSPFDAAFPGTLPHLNPKCVELGIRTAIALNSQVQRRSAFDRKHYFYADLPSGYQITQQYAPFAKGGSLKLSKEDVSVRVKQIQLEQDTGKSTFHPRQQFTAIDLNRAGTGLMEIVSEPDMRSPEEAGDYVRTLQSMLRCVGSSDGNMEQGSLRCDVNVSVNQRGSGFGTRCEIKNLNSVRFMMIAITSEIRRQINLLQSGLPVMQETLGFDEARAETYPLRSKEDAPDYRYMPDPNIPPLLLDEVYIADIRQRMPELPAATRTRLQSLGLTSRDIDVLMDVDSGREVGFDGELRPGAVAYFDSVTNDRDPKVVVNWITHELLGQLAFRKETFSDNPMTTEQMGELIDMVQEKKITGTSGKEILRHILTTRTAKPPSELAKELNMLAVSDDNVLERWCSAAISALPQEAEKVHKGNANAVNRLVGYVMKASKGTANAQAVKTALLEMLR
ncbi:Glutamyl-tRNA-Gln amidotransferase B subunit [Obba rivulosa]|uniref:Glutamyl-tRNA(Gln) amidotransferase subunit B, mitochondrial n=1 Tax=Obba rivulosa TaxID=1052685 RepID=A0A8E2J469_9APHY|nr:Glutamyl-tRNA-Gln amidotransferase B subunit [Obba rivulosa]